MITITGSTGQLGRATIQALLALVAPTEIVALARDTDKAADLQSQGVQVRAGDYDDMRRSKRRFAARKPCCSFPATAAATRALGNIETSSKPPKKRAFRASFIPALRGLRAILCL